MTIDETLDRLREMRRGLERAKHIVPDADSGKILARDIEALSEAIEILDSLNHLIPRGS